MKYIKILILSALLCGCAGIGKITDMVAPNPTGKAELDVYLQKIIDGKNVTVCQRIIDLESLLDGYFCIETLDKTSEYYIPVEDWKADELGYKFVLYSKADFREKKDLEASFREFLCRNEPDCDHGPLGSMIELQNYKLERE